MHASSSERRRFGRAASSLVAASLVAAGLIAAGALVASVAGPARAESGFADLSPSYLPDYVGVGPGFAPDYFGSDDYFLGAAPIARRSWGRRYIDLVGNYAQANLIDHPNWQAGPAGVLRFKRGDVEDDVVSRLPSVGRTVELGGFVGYAFDPGEDPRRRTRVSVGFTQDVLDEHGGFVVNGSVRKWFPVGRFGALGVALGATFGSGDYTDTYFSVSPAAAAASGLRAYDAGAGPRDVRVTAVYLQPVSERVVLGAGALYGRILGDAADSPLVADRGSRNQFIVGIGAGILFW